MSPARAVVVCLFVSLALVGASAGDDPSSRTEPRTRVESVDSAANRAGSTLRSSEGRVGAESVLLGQVESALEESMFARALSLLCALDDHFPEDRDSQQRRALSIIAHCNQEVSGARGVADRFLHQHARSPYVGRIRVACGFEDGAAAALERLKP